MACHETSWPINNNALVLILRGGCQIGHSPNGESFFQAQAHWRMRRWCKQNLPASDLPTIPSPQTLENENHHQRAQLPESPEPIELEAGLDVAVDEGGKVGDQGGEQTVYSLDARVVLEEGLRGSGQSGTRRVNGRENVHPAGVPKAVPPQGARPGVSTQQAEADKRWDKYRNRRSLSEKLENQ